jgi:hypothetical protein
VHGCLSVVFVCCVGSGLRDVLIAPSIESHWVCLCVCVCMCVCVCVCVCVCGLVASQKRRFRLDLGCCLTKNINILSSVVQSRSQWSHGLRHKSAVARLLRLRVRIPPESWMFVSCEYCMSSGRGLCVGCSLVQRSPTDCSASFGVINTPHE